MVLDVHVLHQCADAQRTRLRDLRGLEADVVRANLRGVVAIDGKVLETEQFGEALAIERPTRVGQYCRAERAAVHTRPRLTDAVGVARETVGECRQIVGVADRHRLHAIGVGGTNVSVCWSAASSRTFRNALRLSAKSSNLGAHLRHIQGRVDILAAAAAVDQCRLGTGDIGDDLLSLQDVARAFAAGLVALVDRVRDPMCDRACRAPAG